MILAGVDGCRGGWIMVAHDMATDDWRVHHFARWDERPPADLTAVDMPIGLPDSGRRGCDFAARGLLGRHRQASVFIGLRRPLLDFADYPAANAWAKADGSGLSKQAWFLLPRIAEIDRAIGPADQEHIRECHPELAFLHLAGEPLVQSKRTPDGLERRRRLLEAAGIDTGRLLTGLDRRMAAADDLFDAAAICLTAGRIAAGSATRLPAGDPPADGRGLRMEIWY